MKNLKNIYFENVILKLQSYWSSKGCSILQPLDIEIGAGTSHPITCLKALGPKPIAATYVQPVRRPTDGRYSNNPNRLQHYYQFQVIIKPSPKNIQELYLCSLKKIGLDLYIDDIRFIEDNWENPTLGAWGVGWEVWINGMEITQFTYFQKIGGLQCSPITVEITYGLERIVMHLQNLNNVFDIKWNKNSTYRDYFYNSEYEQSIYNFEYADINFMFICFENYIQQANNILKLKKPLPIPAYELVLKAAHQFNLLDARKAISVTERQRYILCIRNVTIKIAEIYSNENYIK